MFENLTRSIEMMDLDASDDPVKTMDAYLEKPDAVYPVKLQAALGPYVADTKEDLQGYRDSWYESEVQSRVGMN